MNICSLENCNRPIRARKLCGSHYQKSVAKSGPNKSAATPFKPRHVLSDLQDGLATCSVCGAGTEYYAHPSGQNKCRTVERARQKRRVRTRDYSNRYFFGDGQSIRHKDALSARLRFYQEQNGCCAICKRHESVTGTLHLDHCHDDGKLRGLLCADCNKGLGFFRDSPENLVAASEYLTR